jgi:crotonobetainyl-CoA:carnitine CoA-transferase CaiB-like acyl-CoA transferase
MSTVFEGRRVVELATGIAGPYAAMFLADLGADVIKVEPTADPYRTEAGFQSINRNKRSVRDVPLPDLLATADVVITDRPGTAWKLRSFAPDAVIVSVPPWGERGPAVEDPSSPSLLAAACGMAWNQQSYTEGPVHLVLPLVPYATAPLAALAAASGLLLRDRTGAAPTYEVSQVAGAAAFQLEQFRVGDLVEDRAGSAPMGSKGRVPIYRLFRCADDRWLFMACGTVRFYERLLELIGRPELRDDPRLPAPPWGLMDLDAIALIAPLLESVFETRPRHEWLRLLREADIPVQPVQTRDEFLASSLCRSNELTLELDHPELGPVRIGGRPVRFASGEGPIDRPAPQWGADDDEVGAELAAIRSTPIVAAAPAAVSGAGWPGHGVPPLDGVRVLDLASFIAGPVVSRHLAMLGADVIKVEAPTGDPFRAFGEAFAAWNHGKRSIALDLTTDAGRTVLHRLVAGADVVVENFRPGVAAKLGCDHETLRAINPELVYLSSPGYGNDPELAAAAAFDPLLQALGGVMDTQGGDDEPVFLTPPLHDVMAPMLGAFGVVAALVHRRRGHGGQRVLTSLTHATLACQMAEVTAFAGAPAPPRGGFDFKGPGPGLGLVETDHGWEAVDGPYRVAVSTTGLVNSALAAANELVVTHHHPAFGTVTAFGQLVRGAGAPPARGPLLDEHGDEIRAELDAGPGPGTAPAGGGVP